MKPAGNKTAIVIGAGPGGLTAAMLLKASGVDVTLVERLDRVGGRCSTLVGSGPGEPGNRLSPRSSEPGTRNPAPGYRFDMGPTFFLYPRILEEVFEACGEDLHDHVELRRLDPQYDLVFEGDGDRPTTTLHATPDVARMREQIAKLAPADAEHFPRFLAENREKFEAFRPILQRPWLKWTDLLSPSMAKMLPLVRPWASVDGDLKRYFADPRVRLAFSFQSKYLGMSPFNCPSLFTILSYLEYDYGVWHPVGGCGAVSEAMAEVAVDMGVDLRLGEAVDEVLFDGRKAVGVRTPRGDLRADAVVVNADFAQAMHTLVPDRLRRKYSDRRLAKKKYSCSTFMLYLGIEGRYDHLAHHTIFLAGDYTQNLREIERDHVLSANPSLYVQNASVTDDTLAPDGHSTLYVLAPVTHQHGNVDWERDRDAFRGRVIDQLRKLGIEDLEDRIRYEQVFTPAHWQREMQVYRGATFNLAHNLTQMLHLRPRNRFEEFENMYIAGGGTHPGSGLPVIYEGARISARLACEDLGVEPAFRPPTPLGASPGLRDNGARMPALDPAPAPVFAEARSH